MTTGQLSKCHELALKKSPNSIEQEKSYQTIHVE